MPNNEKEYNGNLFGQLSILERLEKVARAAQRSVDVGHAPTGA